MGHETTPDHVSSASLTTAPSIASSQPPPLPPRSRQVAQDGGDSPPPYDATTKRGSSQYLEQPYFARDSRSSSTQSLVQQQSRPDTDRRRLLLIWIHGYMGSEVSFQSFPAHVHHTVTQKIQESGAGTHVVHTKIYPRYESRYRIQGARDAFSEW